MMKQLLVISGLVGLGSVSLRAQGVDETVTGDLAVHQSLTVGSTNSSSQLIFDGDLVDLQTNSMLFGERLDANGAAMEWDYSEFLDGGSNYDYATIQWFASRPSDTIRWVWSAGDPATPTELMVLDSTTGTLSVEGETVLTESAADARYLRGDGDSLSFGLGSSATGYHAIALGDSALAQGQIGTPNLGAIAIGNGAAAGVSATTAGIDQGSNPIADPQNWPGGGASVAVGENAFAGQHAVAVGSNARARHWNVALGLSSTAYGNMAFAVGYNSNAAGDDSVSIGTFSHGADKAIGIGYVSRAVGIRSFGAGSNVWVEGANAIALGYGATARGTDSISLGTMTEARRIGQIVLGRYNVLDGHQHDPVSDGDNLFIIGNGNGIPSDPNERSDAFVIQRNGDVKVFGTLTVGGDHVLTELDADLLYSRLDGTSIAVGSGSATSGIAGSIAIGENSSASSTGTGLSVALGAGAQAASDNNRGGTAVGSHSRALSQSSSAFGASSFADGVSSTAIGASAYAPANSISIGIGSGSGSQGDPGQNISIGHNSSARYYKSTVVGSSSSADASGSAFGSGATAVGTVFPYHGSVAVGLDAHADGSSIAIGWDASAEQARGVVIGSGSEAVLSDQIILGHYNVPSVANPGDTSLEDLFVLANGTDDANRSNAFTISRGGDVAVSGQLSVGGVPVLTESDGNAAYARLDQTSLALGGAGSAGNEGFAFGVGASAPGSFGFAFGRSAYAATGSIAHGYSSIASGGNAVSIGHISTATGDGAVSLGVVSRAKGDRSVSLGFYTDVVGDDSIGIGKLAKTLSANSIALGNFTHAAKPGQVVVGAFNTLDDYNSGVHNTDAPSDRVFVVGAGLDENSRSDAFVVRRNGKVDIEHSDYDANDLAKSGVDVLSVKGHGSVDGNLAVANALTLGGVNVATTDDLTDLVTSGGLTSALLAYTPTTDLNTQLGDYALAADLNDALFSTSSSFSWNNGSASAGGVSLGGDSNSAAAAGSLAVGGGEASGQRSFALGDGAHATGSMSIAVGAEDDNSGAVASGPHSFSFGIDTVASKDHAFAFGEVAEAEGEYSLAFGNGSRVTGDSSFVLGQSLVVGGAHSGAMGVGSLILGDEAFAVGRGLWTFDKSTVAVGRFNEDVPPAGSPSDRATANYADGALFVVGNGDDIGARSNAVVVRNNGHTTVQHSDYEDADKGKAGVEVLEVNGHTTFNGVVIIAEPAGGIAVDPAFQ